LSTHLTRQKRIADQIQKDLSSLIRLRIKDPRIGMLTVTWVDVAADYSHAKIFISSLLGEASIQQSLEVLREAAGFLRRELGKGLKLRTIPQLHFMADESIERGARMGALIDGAIAADAELMGNSNPDDQASSAESFDIRAIPGVRP
jgi:ribosome-binding factor A